MPLLARFVLALLFVLTLNAQTAEPAPPTDPALLQRLQRLEARIAELEQRLATRDAIDASRPTVPAANTPTSVGSLPADLTFKTKTGAKIGVYGYLKLDGAYDTSRMNSGNMAFWVMPETTNDNDDEFNLTANQTRLGLTFEDPDLDGLKAAGKLEMDFYGGGAENKSHPRMRQAYLTLDWPAEKVQILAGQTADVIASLTNPMINFGVGAYAGNIGYRHPQLRLTKTWDDLEAVFALSRTIGDATAESPGDTGEDSGFPTMQARLGYKFPIGQKKPLDVAVSGHWGQEEYDTDKTGAHDDYDTWSTVFQFVAPLGSKAELMGETFYGANLATFRGGIGQSVNTTTGESINAWGGWLALRVKPTSDYALTLGAGLDDPDDNDLNSGMRSRNQVVYGNVLYNLTSSVQLGLEISHWRTDYKDQKDADALRLQSTLVYHF